jgi:hypothetical protein
VSAEWLAELPTSASMNLYYSGHSLFLLFRLLNARSLNDKLRDLHNLLRNEKPDVLSGFHIARLNSTQLGKIEKCSEFRKQLGKLS